MLQTDTETDVSMDRLMAYQGDKGPKLSQLKGKTECAERAALGQYLLQKSGLKSAYMSGITMEDAKDLDEFPTDHSYIVVEEADNPKETMIFDIARPHSGVNNEKIARVLRTETPLNYELLKDKEELLVAADDVLQSQRLWFGVGWPTAGKHETLEGRQTEAQEINRETLIGQQIQRIAEENIKTATEQPNFSPEKLEQFRIIFNKLGDFGRALVEKYHSQATDAGLNPGKIRLYLVGGRINGTPLREESDLDFVIEIEDPKQGLQYSNLPTEQKMSVFSEMCQEVIKEMDLPAVMNETYIKKLKRKELVDFAGERSTGNYVSLDFMNRGDSLHGDKIFTPKSDKDSPKALIAEYNP